MSNISSWILTGVQEGLSFTIIHQKEIRFSKVDIRVVSTFVKSLVQRKMKGREKIKTGVFFTPHTVTYFGRISLERLSTTYEMKQLELGRAARTAGGSVSSRTGRESRVIPQAQGNFSKPGFYLNPSSRGCDQTINKR